MINIEALHSLEVSFVPAETEKETIRNLKPHKLRSTSQTTPEILKHCTSLEYSYEER